MTRFARERLESSQPILRQAQDDYAKCESFAEVSSCPGHPKLNRRTECDGYLGTDHALTSAATRYDGYHGEEGIRR